MKKRSSKRSVKKSVKKRRTTPKRRTIPRFPRVDIEADRAAIRDIPIEFSKAAIARPVAQLRESTLRDLSQQAGGEQNLNWRKPIVPGELLGTWKHYDKGSTSYTVTKYTFSSDGTYSMYEEMSMFFVSPLGSTTNMSSSTDRGTFRILDSGEVELVSNVVGRSVKRGNLMGGTLSLGYQQYYR